MRNTTLLAAAAATTVFATAASAQVTLLSEDFETDGNGTRYTTSVAEFSDGSNDYFLRTDGSDINAGIEFTNTTGFYFAAQDIDGEVASSRQTLTFSGIDVTGFDTLTLSIDVAEDDDGTAQDWDADDLVHASFVINGTAPTSYETGYAIWFDNDGSEFNSAPFLNYDFDADGGDSPEDSEVTSAFTTFSRVLGFNGADGSTIVDLVITFDLDSGDEDIAIDNILLTGNASTIPEPATAGLGLLGLAGLAARRRRA